MRRGDWEAALSAYLTECEVRAFAWGSHDCALFAAGGVLAMTGVDPAAEYRGRYRTAKGAARALRRHGNAHGHSGTLEAAIGALFEERPVSFARRGDLALHDGSVGIVAGAVALFVGEAQAAEDPTVVLRVGLIAVTRASWQKSWSVG